MKGEEITKLAMGMFMRSVHERHDDHRNMHLAIRDVMRSVELIVSKLTDPEDDVMPVLIVESTIEGGRSIFPCPFDNDEHKWAVQKAIAPRIATELRAWFVAYVWMGYMIKLNFDDVPEELREKLESGEIEYEDIHQVPPREHPDRIECVNITASTKTRTRMVQAEMLRDGEQPPVLGTWEITPGKELAGNFVGPIREVLIT